MNWKTYIDALLELGWTKRRIAREVGVSETIIYRLMNDDSVDMRHRNGERLKAIHDEAVKCNAALRGDSGLIAGVPLESTVMQGD